MSDSNSRTFSLNTNSVEMLKENENENETGTEIPKCMIHEDNLPTLHVSKLAFRPKSVSKDVINRFRVRVAPYWKLGYFVPSLRLVNHSLKLAQYSRNNHLERHFVIYNL